MGDVNLEIKLSNLDERVIKIEETGGGSGGDGYITSVSNDFNVVNKKLSLSNDVTTKLSKLDSNGQIDYSDVKNAPDLSTKIDKPSTASEGQVLTFDGSNWVAQNSKGGDTSIISDAWESRANRVWNRGEYCIHKNILWKCIIQSGSTTTEPSESATSEWKQTNVTNELGKIKYTEITFKAPTSATSSNYIPMSDLIGESVTEAFFVSGKILNTNGNWYTITTVSDGYCYVTVQNNNIRATLTSNGVSPYGGKDIKAIIAYY